MYIMNNVLEKDQEEDNNKKSNNISVSIGRDNPGTIITGDNKGNIESNIKIQNKDNSQTIAIDRSFLDNIPKEYASSLERFSVLINEKLQAQAQTIDSGKLTSANNNLNQFAKKISENTKDGMIVIDDKKKETIEGKLISAFDSLVDISPKLVETISACIPILSPFSGLLGKSMQSIIEKIHKNKNN